MTQLDRIETTINLLKREVYALKRASKVEEKEYLPVADVLKKFRVSRKTLRVKREQGVITDYKLRSNQYCYNADELEKNFPKKAS